MGQRRSTTSERRAGDRPTRATHRQTALAALLLGLLGFFSPARGEAPAPSTASSVAGPAQAAPRFAPLSPVQIAGKTFYPFSFDGHVHTEYSPDADHPPATVLAAAEREGLHGIVFTDHGSAQAKLDFGKYTGKVLPFVGQEIGGPFGHAVFWNVYEKQQVIPSRTSLAERAAFAHGHGGLIVLCHPGWWIAGRAEDPMRWIAPEALRAGGVSSDIDALELWNGVYDAPLRKLIGAWEEALEAGAYVPIVGNSDFHRLGSHRLGGPRNVVYCEQPASAECVWSAVQKGRLYVTDGPALWFSVQGAPMGELVEVAPGSRLHVQLRAHDPRVGELRLLLGRSVVRTFALEPGKPLELELELLAPSQSSYLRVEIVRAAKGPLDPGVDLLSNPVRVQLRR